jgi:hypothetical protein
VDAQGLARRDHDLEERRLLQQGRDLGGGLHDLLEVVPDQDHVLGREVLGEALCERAPRTFSERQRLCDPWDDEGGIAVGGEVDEEDPVGKRRQHLCSEGGREARLARAPRTHESHTVVSGDPSSSVRAARSSPRPMRGGSRGGRFVGWDPVVRGGGKSSRSPGARTWKSSTRPSMSLRA